MTATARKSLEKSLEDRLDRSNPSAANNNLYNVAPNYETPLSYNLAEILKPRRDPQQINVSPDGLSPIYIVQDPETGQIYVQYVVSRAINLNLESPLESLSLDQPYNSPGVVLPSSYNVIGYTGAENSENSENNNYSSGIEPSYSSSDTSDESTDTSSESSE
jgi:hypothetical protein